MKVVFLTEGNSKIGYGHIIRCYAFNQFFNEIHVFPDFFIHGPQAISHTLKDVKCTFFPWADEESGTLALLKKYDVVIIDSYLADASFYAKTAEIVPLCIYIDDFNRIQYPKGIILNWQINASQIDYKLEPYHIPLLGSNYTILRKEFWNCDKKMIRSDLNSILITMGGSDMKNLTPSILKQITEYFPDSVENVVIGKGFLL